MAEPEPEPAADFRGEQLSDSARQMIEARSGRDLMAKGPKAFKSSGAMEKRKSNSGGWKKRYLNLEEVAPTHSKSGTTPTSSCWVSLK